MSRGPYCNKAIPGMGMTKEHPESDDHHCRKKRGHAGKHRCNCGRAWP